MHSGADKDVDSGHWVLEAAVFYDFTNSIGNTATVDVQDDAEAIPEPGP